MKTYYKINEISKLYNIGQDSLRYYEELGILHPMRDKTTTASIPPVIFIV